MKKEQIIRNAIAYITNLFESNSGGHDVGHTMRVYKNTLCIAKKEPGCDITIAALAALLHDVDDQKLFDTRDNANARAFLEEHQVSTAMAGKICAVINAVSFSQNRGYRPDTAEERIVQDADRLDAIGAVGIARAFAYGGEHGRSFHDSVQHFDEKLLLLKDEMNTETARQIAQARHKFMESFLEELSKETGDFV